jgi:DUF4097 and DUF4098 domain-containing protein YvlB
MLQLNTIKVMPRGLLLMMVCLFTFSACTVTGIVDPPSDDASGNATVVEPFSYTVTVANQSRFRIEGINGLIDIVGVPGVATIEIRGERRVRSKSEEDARDYLRHLEVRVTDSNDEVFVKTVQPQENHGRNLEVIYYIRMPENWEAGVGNVNGDVVIDSLAGDVSVGLVNGSVQLREISANTAIGLTNGNVLLTKIIGSTLAAVVNGNIYADVTLPQKATCEMSTVNGSIDLRVPQSTSAQFSAEVVNGTIRLTNLNLQNATTTPKTTRGRLANGDGQIKLKTVNGNIRVEGVE